jgi:hypothetical protein
MEKGFYLLCDLGVPYGVIGLLGGRKRIKLGEE